MIYPQKLNSKKGEIILKVLMIFSVMLAVLLIIINKITTPGIPWSGIANCGIIYIWVTVMYSIKRSNNIAGHVLLQTIIMAMVVLYIDEKIGFYGWSFNIAIPIILIVANIIMLILTVISYKKYIKYAIYQLAIVLISLSPFILMTRKNIELQLLGKVASVISVLNLLVTLVLCYKDIKEAIIRKIHM